jgi:hypothetical protein
MGGESTTGQLLPCWFFTTHDKATKSTKCMTNGMNEMLTGRRELVRLLKLPGATEGRDSNSVGSISTNSL